MSSNCVTAKFQRLKNCFLYLPPELAIQHNVLLHSNASHNKNVLRLEWEGCTRKVFVTTIAQSLQADTCVIDRNFANSISIPNSAKLWILTDHNAYIPDCISIAMIPVSVDDWNTLEPEVSRLETTLLDQIRVVWAGMTLPFWLHSNICVYLRILSTEPQVECVYLQRDSELNLFPDERQFKNYQKDKLTPQTSLCEHEPVENKLESAYSDDEEVGLYPIAVMFANAFNTYLNPWGVTKHVSTEASVTEKQTLISQAEKLLANSNSAQKIYLSSGQYTLNGCDFILRSDRLSTISPALATLITAKQPIIIWILIADINKETIEPKTGGDSKNNDDVIPHYTQIPIRLIMQPGNIHTNNELFDICVERMVSLKGVNIRIVMSKPSQIKLLTLCVRRNVLEQYSNDDIIINFKRLINYYSREDVDIPIYNLQWIRISVEGIVTFVCINLEFVQNSKDLTSQYALINAKSLARMKINILAIEELNIKLPSEPNINSLLPNKDNFAGYEYLKTESADLLGSFLSPLNKISRLLSICVRSDSNLPLSGKKTFTKWLLHVIGKFQSCIDFYEIDSFELKGKRLETIRKHFREAMEVGLCGQDSLRVVLLYNLDYLLPHDKADESKIVSDSLILSNYLKLMSENWKRFSTLKQKLIIIATVKDLKNLNERLIQNKIFTYHFVIHRPSNEDKISIFKFKLSQYYKFTDNNNNNNNNINFDKIMSQNPTLTSGDFDFIIKRANHHLYKNQQQNPENISQITNDVIEEVLTNYMPIVSKGNKDFKINYKINFKIGGLFDVRRKLEEQLVIPLRYPKLASMLPLKLKLGVLLYGPPGTGKTLLVQELASIARLNLVVIRGPQILDKYIGASEENIRRLFSHARNVAPSILLLDEFDCIARRRGSERTGVMDRIVNQLLIELDGVESLEGVAVVATTVHPELIDSALLRSGRIGTHYYCGLPSKEERKDILKKLIESTEMRINENVNFDEIANKTVNFTGADLKGLLINVHILKQNQQKDDIADNNCQGDKIKLDSKNEPTQNLTSINTSVCSVNQKHMFKLRAEKIKDGFVRLPMEDGKSKLDNSYNIISIIPYMEVTHRDIMLALENTNPSLSPDNLKHYQAIQSLFKNKNAVEYSKQYYQQKSTFA